MRKKGDLGDFECEHGGGCQTFAGKFGNVSALKLGEIDRI